MGIRALFGLGLSAHMIAVEDNQCVWRCLHFRKLVYDATNLTVNPCQTYKQCQLD